MATGFKKATVNAASVPATQTNFPAYVDLSRLGITTLAEAQSVRVYANSGKTTEWAREIVSATEMHVKVPSLTSTTPIYVDWDGVRADYAVTDTYGRNAVWSGVGYAGRWHLNESSGNAADSTVNSNTATNVNTVTYTTSQINNGANFVRASSQHLDATDSASLSITGNLTVSFWVYFATLPTSGQVYGLITKDSSASSNREWWIDYYNTGSGYQLRSGFHSTGSGSRYNHSYLSYTFSATTWYKVDITITPTNSATTKHRFYINGADQGNGTGSDTGGTNTSIYNGTNPFVMGGYNAAGVYHNGRLDEVGYIASNLSADWITTEYNNQSAESTFWGTWSDVGGGSANTTDFFIMA